MKRLHFTRPNNLSKLHDELLAAMPGLRPVLNAQGEREAVMQAEGKADDIWLTVPDSTDDVAVTTVVRDHDALAPRSRTRRETLKGMAVSGTLSAAQIQEALGLLL